MMIDTDVANSSHDMISSKRELFMADSDISLTPSDIIGAVKQGLIEMHQYLSQPLQEINPNLCIPHMERMMDFVHKLAEMHGPRPTNEGARPEARKN